MNLCLMERQILNRTLPGGQNSRSRKYLHDRWSDRMKRYISFSWAVPLLRRAQRVRLEREDMYQLPNHILNENVTSRLER